MSRRTKVPAPAVLPDSGLLSIGALATATGIPVQTLRTWERRYGAPEPTRKPSGHRLYPVSLVGQLRKVATLLERGHRPGEILALPSAELDSLLSLTATGTSRIAYPVSIGPAALEREAPAMREMLHAVRQLDRDSLIGALRENWVRLGPLRFLQDCAGSLMQEVGTAWKAGTLEIRHEHFATACLAGFLREVREPFDRQARGPHVIAAMLPGDVHEGGLLMVSVLLAIRGCRIVYLGPDVPVEQVTAAASECEARAIALSVSSAVSRRKASAAIAALRRAIPRHTALWVGGAGVPEVPKGVERFETLAALDEWLATRA